MLYRGDGIVGEHDVLTFNSIASTGLKLFTFKFISRMHYLHHAAFLNSRLVLFSIVGFPWLRHTPSVANVTMEVKACALREEVKLN
jgi:hypothetical protein